MKGLGPSDRCHIGPCLSDVLDELVDPLGGREWVISTVEQEKGLQNLEKISIFVNPTYRPRTNKMDW